MVKELSLVELTNSSFLSSHSGKLEKLEITI